MKRSSSRWASQATKAWTSLLSSQVRQASRLVAASVQPAAAQRKRLKNSPGDWVLGHAIGTGGARRYRLYRPPGVLSSERLPLLVMLHGCGQTADSFAASTRMNAIAAKHRFLVLYPEQDRLANPQGCWNWFELRSGRALVEAASVVQAIDQVVGLYPVDPAMVAVAGLSAGASLAGLLATRYPLRFQAVCMHSGVLPGLADSTATAMQAMRGHRDAAALDGTALPPLLLVHGDGDRIVAHRNAQITAQAWATSQGAVATPSRRVQRGQRHPMRITEYRSKGKSAVTLCEVAGLGHAWSGGLASQAHSDARGPDASALVYAFVARHWNAVMEPVPKTRPLRAEPVSSA